MTSVVGLASVRFKRLNRWPTTDWRPMNRDYSNIIGYGKNRACLTGHFWIDTEPGLLVAFDSATLHEVTPVVAGRRLSAVDWFY